MWGHVGLRVREDRTGTDLVFDWGLVEARDSFALPRARKAPSEPDRVVAFAGADVGHPLSGRNAQSVQDPLGFTLGVAHGLVRISRRDDRRDRPVGDGETQAILGPGAVPWQAEASAAARSRPRTMPPR
ncbi:MAG: hypothetical protein ACREK6_04160 [Candidatus Rokuibacteriota bacterium]